MTTFTLIDGPSVLLGYGGLQLLVDPTFDPPGTYEPRPGVRLTKLNEPALSVAQLPPLDVVLISHDQHPDNLDDAGRRVVAEAPLALTTPAGAERLGPPARPLDAWGSIELARPDAPPLTITAVPAQHGPEGGEHLTGPVTGFQLAADDLRTVYVSGDNASLAVVRQIADRLGSVDVAILNAGAAQLDGELVTLSSERAAEAARLLGARAVLPVHYTGWSHFTEGANALRAAFRAAGSDDLLLLPAPGETIELA